MTITSKVPALAHDAYMLKRFNQTVSANGVLERRIIANLCAYLITEGFVIWGVDDSEKITEVHTKKNPIKEAMEVIFNLDDATIIVSEGNNTWGHEYIRLTLGEGFDIISDYTYVEDSKFMHVMDAFDAEDFA